MTKIAFGFFLGCFCMGIIWGITENWPHEYHCSHYSPSYHRYLREGK